MYDNSKIVSILFNEFLYNSFNVFVCKVVVFFNKLKKLGWCKDWIVYVVEKLMEILDLEWY